MEAMYDLISWNVQVLSDGVKRVALFNALKPFSNAVVCLQETHL